MRIRLSELQPEWLSDGAGRERMGFGFSCVEHHNCRVEVWLDAPFDGELSVTEMGGRQLHLHEGQDWETLSVYPPIRHGECFIHLYEGELSFC